MSNIDRIIVFGCSYATGEELLYDELDSSLLSIRNNNKDPRIFFNAIESNELYQLQYADVIKRQYDLAWPKALADKLNVECVNFAESGNSMQKMLWQFLNYRNNITENDLVIFSQTKPDRNMFFKDKPRAFQIASILNSKEGLIGVADNGNAAVVMDTETDKAILKWFTDDRIVWDEIIILMSIAYLKNFYNIRIAPSVGYSDCYLEYSFKEYNTPVFSETFNLLKQDNLLLGRYSMDHYAQQEGDYLLWGHPSERVHNIYAEYLFEELTNVQV
jgi:hypothetical protein